MTSSMLTGDRRWNSGRRGGMTVIGKVAVPKPINLPSQRLENHGLDPSVEIVPKGTLSWGSRSSSSATNAWGSSTLSPHTDGGSSSPSHLSGRPSSGGSGTRPSTAGSDRAHELNAWGSNSRPSSASGVLTSNQTSLTSLRPRSAETRPGSSQLSRFAEPLSENSVARGAGLTTEKLGVASSKNDGFSLTSGDFPTLGSEKENSGKNAESQDHSPHGRPGSSSGVVAPVKERTGTSIPGDVSVNANVKAGTSNSWRRDHPPYGEDGVRPNVEKWQVDPQPYPNASIPPQHYDAWHGPPINNHPGGVWYRGPPGGPPPYGSPVPPGGFPMEPFPYYRPLANPQPVPPPGAGPRGPHPKNGDMYRPHMPDAYIRPGIPIRPGFYPGPVAYEGYYGPPMGYCNSNERDIPFMGMPAGPSAYNRYPGQNAPDPSNSHARSSGYGPAGKALVSEQVESGHPHDTQGPYKVLLKQHDSWDGKDEEQNWEDRVTSNASYVEKGDQPRMASWDNDWRADHKKEEEMDLRRKALGEEAASQTFDHREGASSVPVKFKSPEIVGNVKVSDKISVKKSEHAASAFQEVPAAPRDSSLIQQIKSLNAKARAADGRHDVISASSREEQKNKTQVVNAKANHSATEGATGSVYFERTHSSGITNPASHKVSVSSGDKSLESTVTSGTAISRRSTHGMHGRFDHRNKGSFNTQDVDGWRKKFPVADSAGAVSASHSESSSDVHMQDQTPVEVTEKSGPYPQGKDEGDSVPPMFDPSDSQAQRAKTSEQAKQRMKQRQKEEEERTRDQKAKARAKLEELDRRPKAIEASNQKSETVPSGVIQNQQEESRTLVEQTVAGSKLGASSSASVSNSNVVAQISESSTSTVEKPTVLSSETPKCAHKEPVIMHNQSVPFQQEVNSADAAQRNTAPQVHDNSSSKQKRIPYKQKQNILDKSTFAPTTEAPKSHTDVAGNVTAFSKFGATEVASRCESSLPVNPDGMAESPVHQRRRSNKSSKNKHKVDEASSTAALPSVASKEANNVNTLAESGKSKTSESVLDPSFVQPLTDSKDASQSSEQPVVNEEAHGRVNNQWKSQHSRRMPRNPQAMWAPVRTQNRSEVTEEASQKGVVEGVTPSIKSDNQVQNNPRKRAEIERYIPKPVAKEMAQQGSIQQPVTPSINQNISDDKVEKVDSGSQGTESSAPAGSAIGKVGSVVEFKNGDGRQNKQGKGHGSWRQRGSESTIVQGLQDAPSSQPSRTVQKSVEHCHLSKPEVSSVKEQPKYSDEWNDSDSWNTANSSDSAAPVLVPAVKDQGGTGRGKRHAFKGYKGTGSKQDFDHKKISSGDTDKVSSQATVPEMSQTDLPAASKENRGVGERSTSHWQPKSQAYSATNQRGSRPNGSQNVSAEVGRINRKDSTPQGGVLLPPQLDKETSEGMAQSHHTQFLSDKSVVEEAPNEGHKEVKRERKMPSLRGHPDSLNQGPGSPVEQAPPSNVDIRHEHRSTLGFRKNGNQNSRPGRGQDYRGEWSSSGQDNKQHNPSANRERQRHNPHYEYQPVGSQNNSRANNFEGSKDGSQNSGSRFRERSQSHSRRGGGNFY